MKKVIFWRRERVQRGPASPTLDASPFGDNEGQSSRRAQLKST